MHAELVDDLEDISENEIVMMMNKRNPELFDAYRLNVATGEMKMIAENPGHVDHWVTDHKGRILAATESDGVNATLLTRPDENSPFTKVLSTNFRERVTPEFYTFDNKEIYATSNIDRDKVAIVGSAFERLQLAAGTMFRGFGPPVIAATGLLALVTAAVQALWFDAPPDPIVFLGAWVAVAIVSSTDPW